MSRLGLSRSISPIDVGYVSAAHRRFYFVQRMGHVVMCSVPVCPELQSCTYLYFNGMPFEDPNDFSIAIGIVNEAIANYPFERFGWGKSDDAPYLGMGAEPETGARAAVPVKKVDKIAKM